MLFFLCSVLAKKAYLLFNILSPLDFPTSTLLAFLQTAGRSNVNVAAICKLIQGHANVSTVFDDQLENWTALVDHPSCLLHSMTVRYDGGDPMGPALQSLVDALSRNTTLHTVKVIAVIGEGLEEPAQLEMVARQLERIMSKPKLQSLELAVSSLDSGEEEHLTVSVALQPLVDAMCSSIGRTAITKLVLDAELSGGQVSQLCRALPFTTVRSLHLLHLSCAWNGFQALANFLLAEKRDGRGNNNGGNCNVTGLDLSGCWAATASLSGHQMDLPVRFVMSF